MTKYYKLGTPGRKSTDAGGIYFRVNGDKLEILERYGLVYNDSELEQISEEEMKKVLRNLRIDWGHS